MARPRFHRAEQKMQEAILSAAAKEFCANGYAGASVNRILAEAGLSKGAFYYYFDDKADLAATVLEETYRESLEILRDLEIPDEPFDFWKILERYTRKSVVSLQRSPQQLDLATRLGMSYLEDPEVARRLAPLFEGPRDQIARLIRRGQRAGQVRDDLSLEELTALLQGIKATLAPFYFAPDRTPPPGRLDQFVGLLMDLIRRVAEARAPSRRRRVAPGRRRSRAG